jgi:hypothetical protein
MPGILLHLAYGGGGGLTSMFTVSTHILLLLTIISVPSTGTYIAALGSGRIQIHIQNRVQNLFQKDNFRKSCKKP